MAYDFSPAANAAALKARRGDLRAFCEGLADLLVEMPMPESFVEAERGARAVYVADRALVRVREETLGGTEESDPSVGCADTSPCDGEEKEDGPEDESVSLPYLMTRVRLRLRDYADRLMAAAAALKKPTCYLEAERAARYALAADRMLGQLYAPPKPAKGRFGDDEDLEPEDERPPYDDLEAWQNLLLNKLLRIRQGHASAAGFWPNGAPYIDGEPEPEGSSPFPISDAVDQTGHWHRAKENEMLTKSRAWYAQTHQRDSEPSEAETAELIARIEADWDSGQLQQDYPPSFPSPPHSSWGGGAAKSATEGSLAERSDPSVIFGPKASLPPPHEEWGGEGEGPSIRVVESVFAPNRFGRRPCGCSLSAPKCVGPCPIPP